MKWTLVSAIAIVWALMMHLLFEREIRPYLEFQKPPSYRQMLVAGKEPRTVRMDIRQRMRPIGTYTAKVMSTPGGQYRIDETIDMDVDLKMFHARTRTTTKTIIDGEFQLYSFDTEVGIPLGKPLKVRGRRINPDMLSVTLDGPFGRIAKTLRFSKDMTLSNDLSPFVRLPGLVVGQKWTLHTMAPDIVRQEVSIQQQEARVVELETIGWGDGEREETVHRIEIKPPEADTKVRYRVWVGAKGEMEGHVLRVEQGDGSDPDALRLERLPDAEFRGTERDPR